MHRRRSNPRITVVIGLLSVLAMGLIAPNNVSADPATEPTELQFSSDFEGGSGVD